MISVIINVDTRPVRLEFQGLKQGVSSRDFLVEGVRNKKKFFQTRPDTEFIVFVDEHEPLTNEQYSKLHAIADCVVVRRHSKRYREADPFHKFNDINYIQALAMARGEYIAHFDQDMAAFCANGSTIDWMINVLNKGEYRYISYPSANSPHPCAAPEYEGKFWASTRFFMCKREEFKFDVLEQAIREPEWFYEAYDRPPRINPWTEQFLGIMADYKVLYPHVDLDQWMVFPWMTYRDGTLEKLNSMPHLDVANAVRRAGGEGVFYDGVDVNLLGI